MASENYVIKGWRLYEASSSPTTSNVVIDIKKGADYGTATSIAGSEKPTLTAQDNNSDTTLTTWTTSISTGDFLWFNIDSTTSARRLILALEMEKS
jgi:hypothetical protein